MLGVLSGTIRATGVLGMSPMLDNPTRDARLAEAALRNLHVDCVADRPEPAHFGSRLLHLGDEGLVLDAPVHQGRPVELVAGESITGSFRLGTEILRFRCQVIGPATFRLNARFVVPVVVLRNPASLELVQQRRYYRVGIVGRHPTDVTLWPIMPDSSGETRVTAEFHATVVNLSAGGIGVLISDPGLLETSRAGQLWARFALPGENESLIFRVEYRHDSFIEHSRQYLVGLEIVEYIEPGAHAEVIDRLARFVAQEQRAQFHRCRDC